MESRNTQLRRFLVYAVSLILSLITIVVSSTVFIVVVYINGTVTSSFLYLFIVIAGINVAILSLSVRGVMKLYPLLSSGVGTQRVIIVDSNPSGRSDSTPDTIAHDEKYFTRYEIEIIDLLRKNRNRMLQSTITSSLSASKATVSRALSSLETKGTIIRLRKGVTNEIVLFETYSR